VTLGGLGLIGTRIQFRADLGYGNSFHQAVPDSERDVSFSGIIGGASAKVNLADRDILSLAYTHDFADSLFGNFIARDAIDFNFTHAFSYRVHGTASMKFAVDRYSDIPPLEDQQPIPAARVDLPFDATVRGDYFLREDFKVGGNLSILGNVSNFVVRDLVTGGINDANYVEIQAGVIAVYTY
jgi:hypothetical protein